VLRRIFVSPKEEVAGERRKLHVEELHNLFPPNTIEAIKSRTARLSEYVARVVEMRNVYKILVDESEGKRKLVRLRVDGRKILKLILNK
jgi:hypothetical protein